MGFMRTSRRWGRKDRGVAIPEPVSGWRRKQGIRPCYPAEFLGVMLFLPGVGLIAVAAHLPEAEFVLGEEGDALHELRALPGVKFGDDDPRRAAVLTRQRTALE